MPGKVIDSQSIEDMLVQNDNIYNMNKTWYLNEFNVWALISFMDIRAQ